MKALQFLQPERLLKLHEVEKPSVSGPHDVIVQVAYAGVCGSDLHVMKGEFTVTKCWMTLGHEMSGVVAEVGERVTQVKVGDRVAVDPNRGCGRCDFCKEGQVHYCPAGGLSDTCGFWRHGGWAEYVLVPEASVHRLPDGLPLRNAALCEPLSCLLRAWDQIQPLHENANIAVLGAGITGVLTSCILHLKGYRRVTVSEPIEARRRFVDDLELGYKTVRPEEMSAEYGGMSEQEIRTNGVDVIIDCSGCSEAMEVSLPFLRMGGRYLVFGLAPPDARVSISPHILLCREISIKASLIDPLTFCRAPALAEALYPRYLRLDKLGVQLFPLENYQQAIDTLAGGQISKAMFVINDSLQ